MNRLPLLPLAVPFACLALLSLVGFLGGSLSLARSMWSGQSSRDWASKVQMATRGRGWSATRIHSITLRHRAKRSSRKWRRGNGFEPPSRAVHTRPLPIELPCHSKNDRSSSCASLVSRSQLGRPTASTSLSDRPCAATARLAGHAGHAGFPKSKGIRSEAYEAAAYCENKARHGSGLRSTRGVPLWNCG